MNDKFIQHRLYFLSILLFVLLVSCQEKEPYFKMRGVVVGVHDLETMDWPKIASENAINTIGTHISPDEVLLFIRSEKGRKFLSDCKKYGIDVENQLHAMSYLLPRNLYQEDSTMFRLDEHGRRVADFNCCISSEKALDVIAKNALECAKALPSTNHRYYFWIDDGAPMCQCSECARYSDSEKSLIIENRIIRELRTFDVDAQLAHLAYHNTIEAPRQIKPEEGIFLEFAPFFRSWEAPLTDGWAKGRTGMSHEETYNRLLENLEVFSPENAVVLEYWLDVSLFSGWKKPAVKLPWNKAVFEADIDTYAKLGISNVTTFAVYIDSAYIKDYKDLSFLKEYGEGLKKYSPSVEKE